MMLGMTTLSVLDGQPNTGEVLDLSPWIGQWVFRGGLYVDCGESMLHEQHGCIRWFRLAHCCSDRPCASPPHVNGRRD